MAHCGARHASGRRRHSAPSSKTFPMALERPRLHFVGIQDAGKRKRTKEREREEQHLGIFDLDDPAKQRSQSNVLTNCSTQAAVVVCAEPPHRTCVAERTKTKLRSCRAAVFYIRMDTKALTGASMSCTKTRTHMRSHVVFTRSTYVVFLGHPLFQFRSTMQIQHAPARGNRNNKARYVGVLVSLCGVPET